MTAKPLTPPELQAVKEQRAKITPAPWRKCLANGGKCPCFLVWSVPADIPVATTQVDYDLGNHDDQEFIAAAPTTIDRLIATVEASVPGMHEPAEEPMMLGENVNGAGRCHSCTAPFKPGDLTCWFGDGDYIVRMHRHACPEPDLWRIEYVMAGHGTIVAQGLDLEIWERPYEESLVAAQDLAATPDAGITKVKLVRVRRAKEDDRG